MASQNNMITMMSSYSSNYHDYENLHEAFLACLYHFAYNLPYFPDLKKKDTVNV